MGMTIQSSFFPILSKFSLIISRSLIFFSPLKILQTKEHPVSPKSSLLRKLTLRVSNNKTVVSVRGSKLTGGSPFPF